LLLTLLFLHSSIGSQVHECECKQESSTTASDDLTSVVCDESPSDSGRSVVSSKLVDVICYYVYMHTYFKSHFALL
jgi:hypothetical protein